MNKHAIKMILIKVSQSPTPKIRYKQVTDLLGIPWNLQTKEKLENILIEIGKDEFAIKKPLINALVVSTRSNGKFPGEGFYVAYGKLINKRINLRDDKVKMEIYSTLSTMH